MHREHRQRQPRQAELFETPQDQPLWKDFPPQVRKAMIQELARLLGATTRSLSSQSESPVVGNE